MYQKAKCHKNLELKVAYEKCQYLEIAKMKKDYQKIKYQWNPEFSTKKIRNFTKKQRNQESEMSR